MYIANSTPILYFAPCCSLWYREYMEDDTPCTTHIPVDKGVPLKKDVA